MMKLLFAATLLSATAVAPVVAEAQQRGAPTRGAPTGAQPLSTEPHGVGALILQNGLYELYQSGQLYKGWCHDNAAYVLQVFKRGPDYRIADEATLKPMTEKEIVPAVMTRCPQAKKITVQHYYKGILLDRNYQTHPYGTKIEREATWSMLHVTIAPNGNTYSLTKMRNEASLVEFQAAVAKVKGVADREAPNRRAAEAAAQQAKARDEARLARAVSMDGKLRVDMIPEDHRLLFLDIYDQNFIPWTSWNAEFYKPYLLFPGVVTAFSQACEASLSPNRRAVDFKDHKLVDTTYGPFTTTRWYQEYTKLRVWVEPQYEAAFRGAMGAWLVKAGQWYARHLRENIVGFYMHAAVTSDAYGASTMRIAKAVGCNSGVVQTLIDRSHNFVTGNWTSRNADGSYKYVDDVTKGQLVRRYAKLPDGFSPEFIPMWHNQRTDIILGEDNESFPLRYISIQHFWHTQLVSRGGGSQSLPTSVKEAMDQNLYQVVTCNYASGHNRRFWNAKAPIQPSQEIQEFARGDIAAASSKCPTQP